VRGPHDLPRVRHDTQVSTAAGDAEVRHQRAPGTRFEQDVVGLHVAVDYPASMRIGQRPGDFAHHASRVGGRKGAARTDSLAQRLALHVTHHEEDEAGGLADAMDGDDVRVRETGCQACLSHEPLARLRIESQVSGQDLYGDVAIELNVAGEVHHSHASASELALERILAGQGGLQVEELGRRMRHDVKNTFRMGGAT